MLADRLAVVIYAKQAWPRSRRNWLMAGAAIGLFSVFLAGLIGMLALLMA